MDLTRRQMLGRLGALLAAGCWPGRLRGTTRAGALRFVVLNDLHHDTAECDPWFERLFRQVRGHDGIAFCAALGDLSNRGQPTSFEAVRTLASAVGVPVYPVPGNHDNDLEENTRIYSEVFPDRLNYTWIEAGWQFVAIDTTDGKKWEKTNVSAATLAWLDAAVPRLDPRKPTVLLTHFPLAASVRMCPVNAEDVLARFVDVNLRGAFSGHYHAQTRVSCGSHELVTNVCCGRVVGNHDGTTEKGYWLCDARADGELRRTFVPFAG